MAVIRFVDFMREMYVATHTRFQLADLLDVLRRPSSSITGPPEPWWLLSRITGSMWGLKLLFCGVDLANSALGLAKKYRICTRCGTEHAASGGTSCVHKHASYDAATRVQRHRDGPVAVLVANVCRAHPHARTQFCTQYPGRFLSMSSRREGVETGIQILPPDYVIITVSWVCGPCGASAWDSGDTREGGRSDTQRSPHKMKSKRGETTIRQVKKEFEE